ncbi:hypothetical protein A8926_2331 [Saccharopolyspora spinosa]|uniref:Uncharacterized protein n=1 Tax=Saccharopolyspora spinosa TaxID=60894 RepID=A0A2N3XVK4_SACSN|nr:hypothetical protein A8926_2331 [Saccharopolyspora spinosa]
MSQWLFLLAVVLLPGVLCGFGLLLWRPSGRTCATPPAKRGTLPIGVARSGIVGSVPNMATAPTPGIREQVQP